MAEHDPPEMSGMPLDRVVLRLKALGVNMVHAALLEALVPPPRHHIDTAVAQLLALGVLARRPKSVTEDSGKHSLADVTKADDGLMLTPLGMLVGSIPLDFKYSRMIVLGAQMGCAAEAEV